MEMRRSYRFAPALMCAAVIIAPAACPAQSAQIVPALVGITQSNQFLPCVGDGTTNCYGIPAGAVAVQPQMFIQPAAPATWYAVFQTGAWSGNLDIKFDLVENKVVVQSATATATAAANSIVLVAVPQSAPSNGFNGSATLHVAAAATPTGGGTPVKLQSGVTVQVGSTTAPFALALAGYSNYISGQEGPPCIACPYPLPPGSVVVWPQNVAPPSNSTVWYVFFQAQNGCCQNGGASVVFTLTEQGQTVMTYPTSGELREGVLNIVGAIEPTGPNNGYSGPATLTVTGKAGYKGGSHPPLKYNSPIFLTPPPALGRLVMGNSQNEFAVYRHALSTRR
jgi:hypothetical protein